MQQILLTLASVVVLLVCCDALIPSESIKKYARLAVGIAVSCLLATPVVELFSQEGTASEYEIPTSGGYIDILETQLASAVSLALETTLAGAGFDVFVECETEDDKITFVTATSNLQLTSETANAIGKYISEITGIEMQYIIIKIG